MHASVFTGVLFAFNNSARHSGVVDSGEMSKEGRKRVQTDILLLSELIKLRDSSDGDLHIAPANSKPFSARKTEVVIICQRKHKGRHNPIPSTPNIDKGCLLTPNFNANLKMRCSQNVHTFTSMIATGKPS
jgi:hypothetical protein